MLTVKIYESGSGEKFCDACSLRLVNTGVALYPVTSGLPCTCDACGLKARAK